MMESGSEWAALLGGAFGMKLLDRGYAVLMARTRSEERLAAARGGEERSLAARLELRLERLEAETAECREKHRECEVRCARLDERCALLTAQGEALQAECASLRAAIVQLRGVVEPAAGRSAGRRRAPAGAPGEG